MATVPPALKNLQGYLDRAKEVQSRNPIVAYYCKMFVLESAIASPTRKGDKDVQMFLLHLMDQVEKLKPSVPSKEEAQKIVEDFALKVFEKAATEDLNGRASLVTAKVYRYAMQFLEVCQVFYEGDRDAAQPNISEDLQTKYRYAKWKAVDIMKAIKNGEKPTPGGPGFQPIVQEEELLEGEENLSTEEEEALIREDGEGEGEAKEAAEGEPEEPVQPPSYSSSELPPPPSYETHLDAMDEPPKAAQPAPSPSVSPSSHPSFPSPSYTPAHPSSEGPPPPAGSFGSPSSHGDRHSSSYHPPQSHAAYHQVAHQGSHVGGSHVGGSRVRGSSRGVPSSVSPSVAPTPTVTPATVAPTRGAGGLGKIDGTSYNVKQTVPFQDASQARKFIKFAQSALDFNDYKTAVKELQEAINLFVE